MHPGARPPNRPSGSDNCVPRRFGKLFPRRDGAVSRRRCRTVYRRSVDRAGGGRRTEGGSRTGQCASRAVRELPQSQQLAFVPAAELWPAEVGDPSVGLAAARQAPRRHVTGGICVHLRSFAVPYNAATALSRSHVSAASRPVLVRTLTGSPTRFPEDLNILGC
jgi:hypothetical protein